MDNIVVINNLNYRFYGKVIFKNFNLSIKRGSFTTIIGNNGSGKSILAKLLTGLIKSDSIYINDVLISIDSFFKTGCNVGVVLSDFYNSFVCDTVYEEMIYPFGIDYKYRVNEVCSILGILPLLDRNPMSLSCGERQLVSLGCALMCKPDLLILDDSFSMIDGLSKISVLNYLKKLNVDYGVTIINLTNDIEESLYGDSIVVIDNGKVVLNDDKVSVYKQEKILKKLGIGLPFMVDLSNRLSYYDLVDCFVYDMDDMVDLLWK